MKKVFFSFLFCLGAVLYARAGTLPALEREVSIRVANEPVKEVLDAMSKQAGVEFSYNPAKVTVNKSVTLSLLKKPVRLVLNILFKNSVQYKQKGNYIILVAAVVPPPEAPVKKITISGYIHDGAGNKLADASVFDKKNQLSAISNGYGFFSLQIPANTLPIDVRVLKENFSDTSVTIKSFENSIDIVLVKIPEKGSIVPVSPDTIHGERKQEPARADTVLIAAADTAPALAAPEKKFLEQWISPKIKASLHNISDTLFTKVQFSFVPLISTNRLLSGHTINDFSFNILAGYSQGVNKGEFGGLANIDRGDVKYFQGAGLINLVGGHVTGAQFAGLLNVNRYSLTGAQGAGLINFTKDRTNGVQAAGLINVCDTVNGTQVAGLINAANRMRGVQVAGLVNVANHLKGVQVSGLISLANKIEGWQCAGILSIAKKVTGNQLALVNVSDSCHGVPVGFFSYVHHGYHKIELAGDEVMPAQLAFRTGALSFHNIFLAGVNPFFHGITLTSVGYGLGSSTPLGKRWNFGGDIITQTVLKDLAFKNVPLLTSVFVGFEGKLSSKFSVVFGPAFRSLITYNQSAEYAVVNDQIAPYTFTDHSFNNGTRVQLWVGGKVSVRFL